MAELHSVQPTRSQEYTYYANPTSLIGVSGIWWGRGRRYGGRSIMRGKREELPVGVIDLNPFALLLDFVSLF